MSLFVIEPEVSGGIGENTVYQNYDAIVESGAIPIITHLHFVFEGWLGDDILEVTPCFLVSEKLKKMIERESLCGYKFQNIEISLSDNFLEMYPNRELPTFFRLIPLGKVIIQEESYTNWDNMDFCISDKAYLVLSEQAKKVIERSNINYADFFEVIPQKSKSMQK